MKKVLAVGIDVSKATLDVCIKFKEKEQHQIYGNTDEGITELITELHQYNKKKHSYKIVMESTGRYHLLAALTLSKKKFAVHIINPLVAKRYFSSFIRKVKTDKADARVLAEVAYQEKKLPRPFGSDKKALQIRQKMGLMASLEKQQQRFKAILSGYLECQEQLGIKNSPAEKQFQIMLKDMTKTIKELEKEISEHILSQSENSAAQKLLKTIPGFSDIVSTLIVQFLDTRCTHPKQWIAYLGMDISVRKSGRWTGKGRITKRGNPYLRKRLYHAAWGAMVNYPDVRAYYDKLKESSRNHVEALLIIARKLLRIAFSVLKKNTPYDPHCSFTY